MLHHHPYGPRPHFRRIPRLPRHRSILSKVGASGKPGAVQFGEPPCTDPYARWCGRGGAARLPPIPIQRDAGQQTGERIAELATILRLAGGLHTISGRIALEAELHTPAIVQRVRKDLAEIYGVRSEAKQMPAASTRPGAKLSGKI